MEGAIAPLSIAGIFGGGTRGNILEGAFRFVSLYLLVLVIIILYKVLKPGGGREHEGAVSDKEKTRFFGGISLGCGFFIGLILWFAILSHYGGHPGTIIAWAVAGGLLGFGIGLIPFL